MRLILLIFPLAISFSVFASNDNPYCLAYASVDAQSNIIMRQKHKSVLFHSTLAERIKKAKLSNYQNIDSLIFGLNNEDAISTPYSVEQTISEYQQLKELITNPKILDDVINLQSSIINGTEKIYASCPNCGVVFHSKLNDRWEGISFNKKIDRTTIDMCYGAKDLDTLSKGLKNLTDYSVKETTINQIIKAGDVVGTIPTLYAQNRTANVVSSVDFSYPTTKDDTIKVGIEFDQKMFAAPILKNKKIGLINVFINGKVAFKTELYPESNIEEGGLLSKMIDWIAYNLYYKQLN
ncbi:hypothetical protein [Photobacterium leiognathi]|uniref:hypothetical protein n=1 Tax=Photobacterium leiognathi TaxID=553611 RepID=UPI002981595D|nr:hypothetical protein [Photobacterium leiognathi]